MTQAYPLKWPDSRPRTERPDRSRFDTTFVVARDSLSEELRRLGARNPVLSTNVELRLDGLPYAARKDPEDTGVAVYFTYKEQQMCFACDRWDRVRDNIQAVRKTIEALRGVARWGTGDMMQKAFDGFISLPPPDTVSQRKWWQVLGVSPQAGVGDIKAAHRKLAMKHHSDHGGDDTLMQEINVARDEGIKEKLDACAGRPKL